MLPLHDYILAHQKKLCFSGEIISCTEKSRFIPRTITGDFSANLLKENLRFAGFFCFFIKKRKKKVKENSPESYAFQHIKKEAKKERKAGTEFPNKKGKKEKEKEKEQKKWQKRQSKALRKK